MENNKFFKSTLNLESGFRLMRTILFGSLLLNLVVIALALFFGYKIYSNNTAEVVKMYQSLALKSQAVNKEPNVKAEIQAHIDLFLKSFFSFDAENIERNLEKGRHLIVTEEGNKIYNILMGNGFYNYVVQANLDITTNLDSIVIKDKIYPYEAMVYCTETKRRGDAKTYHQFKFLCTLEDISRSEHNPNGLIINKIDINFESAMNQ